MHYENALSELSYQDDDFDFTVLWFPKNTLMQALKTIQGPNFFSLGGIWFSVCLLVPLKFVL